MEFKYWEDMFQFQSIFCNKCLVSMQLKYLNYKCHILNVYVYLFCQCLLILEFLKTILEFQMMTLKYIHYMTQSCMCNQSTIIHYSLYTFH